MSDHALICILVYLLAIHAKWFKSNSSGRQRILRVPDLYSLFKAGFDYPNRPGKEW